MTVHHRRFLAPLLVLAAVLAPAGGALAGDDGAKPRETRFIAREAGKEVGLETLRVAKGDTARYASGQVRKKGDKRPFLTSFLQLDGDQRIVKYRRQLEARQGKGVFAFRHGDGLRVVTLNEDTKPVDWPRSDTKVVVWDPRALHVAATWAERLDSTAASVALTALDASTRKQEALVANRGAPRRITGPKGGAIDTTSWAVQRAGAPLATLYVDPAHKVVGIEAGTRTLLVEGYRWDAPPEAAPADPAAEGDHEAPAEGAPATETDDDAGEGP
ncbi:MAG: hypothetical protein H6744_05095 [Deltaproteobacteria bacterium]|nr:hypothetical protein [Deltaproteobacteria bacterium]MCB9786053.1 hypothetical protein [Deltaproteobacteria bacterium]